MQLNNPMSDGNVKINLDKGRDGVEEILIMAAIGSIRYLSYQGTPNVNTRLTQIVNNASAQ